MAQGSGCLDNGMGFIGGGAVLIVKNSIRGTATAASLWATGAIGTAVGLGAYDTAIVLAIVTFLTLRLMKNFKPSKDEEDLREGDRGSAGAQIDSPSRT